MKKVITVYYGEHYNKFMRLDDLVLTCKDNRWPNKVFCDSMGDANDLCKHFLGSDEYVLKEVN